MQARQLFEINPHQDRRGGLLEPSEPEHVVPYLYGDIPGYAERAIEVGFGLRPAWWGTEYTLVSDFPDPSPADLVRCLPAPVRAISSRFRDVLVEGGVAGLHFSPIRVEGTPMYVLGVEGKVEIDPQRFALQLVGDAEFGVYKYAGYYVNTRVMDLMRAAGIDVDVQCIVESDLR